MGLGLGADTALESRFVSSERFDHGVPECSESGTATKVRMYQDPQIEVGSGLAAPAEHGLGVKTREQRQPHPRRTGAPLQRHVVERPADRQVGKGGLADPRPVHTLALPADPLLALSIHGLVCRRGLSPGEVLVGELAGEHGPDCNVCLSFLEVRELVRAVDSQLDRGPTLLERDEVRHEEFTRDDVRGCDPNGSSKRWVGGLCHPAERMHSSLHFLGGESEFGGLDRRMETVAPSLEELQAELCLEGAEAPTGRGVGEPERVGGTTQGSGAHRRQEHPQVVPVELIDRGHGLFSYHCVSERVLFLWLLGVHIKHTGRDAMSETAAKKPLESSFLVRGAIARPDEPRHFMVIEPVEGVITARVGAQVLAHSSRALRVREVGRRIYDPVVYFPPQDVEATALAPTSVTTACPLKGTAVAFDVVADTVLERAAWSYQTTYDFDRRIAQLECCVAFDTSVVTVETAPNA